MKIKRTLPEKVFNVFNIAFLLLLAFSAAYPLWYVICASFSDDIMLISHQGFLAAPLGFTLSAYRMVFKNSNILRAYFVTIMLVVSGVSLNMLLTIIAGYVSSRKNIGWVKLLTKLMVFTMYFSGGLIPLYLLVTRTLHLNNSYLAIILPSAISAYNVIIVRSSFSQIPDSLIESAQLDGASHTRIIWQIIVPLAKATLLVILLYYTVSRWNAWFDASIYLKDRSKYPLQLILRELLIVNDTSTMAEGSVADMVAIGEKIKYAVIVVATMPVLIVYPFIQKYFENGVMLGAVKG